METSTLPRLLLGLSRARPKPRGGVYRGRGSPNVTSFQELGLCAGHHVFRGEHAADGLSTEAWRAAVGRAAPGVSRFGDLDQ